MGDKRKLLFVLWQIIIWDNRLHETRHSFVLTLLQLLVVMRQGDEILNLLLWPLADYVMPVHKLDKAPPPPAATTGPWAEKWGTRNLLGGPWGFIHGGEKPRRHLEWPEKAAPPLIKQSYLPWLSEQNTGWISEPSCPLLWMNLCKTCKTKTVPVSLAVMPGG